MRALGGFTWMAVWDAMSAPVLVWEQWWSLGLRLPPLLAEGGMGCPVPQEGTGAAAGVLMLSLLLCPCRRWLKSRSWDLTALV